MFAMYGTKKECLKFEPSERTIQSIETPKEKNKGVVSEKDELEYQDKSLIRTF